MVPLPSDEMKGRIIGRNGRNIRAFAQATGVAVVVDATPEAVTISSINPGRREVAKRSLEKLVLDGRIHPARIEKLVEDSRKEVERAIVEEGERAMYEVGVPGLHPELVKLVGQLKFRTSYGQNQHAHAIETAHIAGIIAAELGADVQVAKLGGLLHDIGKAIDHEIEGTHSGIGADMARRYKVPEKVVNCIESHHHEVEQTCVEAVIVEAADAISGARPGARRESLEPYITRVKSLEDLAKASQGSINLRLAGRARSANHRPPGGDRRPGFAASGARHRPPDRGDDAVSRPDQGPGHPRDALDRLRALIRRGIRHGSSEGRAPRRVPFLLGGGQGVKGAISRQRSAISQKQNGRCLCFSPAASTPGRFASARLPQLFRIGVVEFHVHQGRVGVGRADAAALRAGADSLAPPVALVPGRAPGADRRELACHQASQAEPQKWRAGSRCLSCWMTC